MERLIKIQQELKAPKNQYNSFGEYSYRSCEDILIAVKPLLRETKTVLTISDELIQLGERFYVKAVATLYDETGKEIHHCQAYAREAEQKTKMDVAQITGASSSYARKYALNGLLAIDDTKDADTDEYKNQQQPLTEEDTLKAQIKKYGSKASELLKDKGKKLSELSIEELKQLLETLQND